jgi:hypothetical protein
LYHTTPNNSEDKCSFIITNTLIVTLFEASRIRNEFQSSPS